MFANVVKKNVSYKSEQTTLGFVHGNRLKNGHLASKGLAVK